MTNQYILDIAMQQSAIDSSCDIDDFKSTKNKVVISNKNPKARKYLELPFLCDLTSYGNNIVASLSVELSEIVQKYIDKFPIENCFETPNLHVLIENLNPLDMNICFMDEYFLPDIMSLRTLDCEYEIKILNPSDFESYYTPEWSNALCDKRKHLDRLAVGAFRKDKLIGLAGCSADCDKMWQIGIDVLPEFRKEGIASCLTSKLAIEVLSLDIVPFYCCAWSNIKSARNAIKSGFKPGFKLL